MPHKSQPTPRDLLKRLPIYAGFKQLGHYPDYWWWKLRGEPRRIPHIVKQRAVLEYAQHYGLTTLVEAGTYYGEMIAAVATYFRRIYSIEVDPELAERAKHRFRSLSHVTVIEGDSQQVVPRLVRETKEACLWWLDAGYCGWAGSMGRADRLGTELQSILADAEHRHTVLMDDADGVQDLAELLTEIRSKHPDREVEVARNILRITPRIVRAVPPTE